MLTKKELQQMADELYEVQKRKPKYVTLQEVMERYNLSSRSTARHRLNLMIPLGRVEKRGTHYHIKERDES